MYYVQLHSLKIKPLPYKVFFSRSYKRFFNIYEEEEKFKREGRIKGGMRNFRDGISEIILKSLQLSIILRFNTTNKPH